MKELNKVSRKNLELYLLECHGFDQDDIDGWETKSDLISDIVSFGWETECKEYLGV